MYRNVGLGVPQILVSDNNGSTLSASRHQADDVIDECCLLGRGGRCEAGRARRCRARSASLQGAIGAVMAFVIGLDILVNDIFGGDRHAPRLAAPRGG